MTKSEFEKRLDEITQHNRDGLITYDEAAAKRLALKVAYGLPVYIAFNEDFDHEVGTDEDEAMERLEENHGGAMVRVVRLMVKATPPKVEDIGEVIVADDVGTTVEVEAA